MTQALKKQPVATASGKNKQGAKPVAKASVIDMTALRKITAQTLDELKNPAAVPSQVIMAALVKACKLK